MTRHKFSVATSFFGILTGRELQEPPVPKVDVKLLGWGGLPQGLQRGGPTPVARRCLGHQIASVPVLRRTEGPG
jgi:hypothetical protein